MMKAKTQDTPALLIIDMVKDNFDTRRNLPITPIAQKIIDPLNYLIAEFRKQAWPMVFSTDAFHREDFIFRGRMSPHSLVGTQGADVVAELDKRDDDFWLPKPRFSAFFKTGLENWLHERGVTLCAVGGISTHFCVLTTVMDAICHDFKAVLLEDCSAAPSKTLHEQTLNSYRKNPLFPLLRVMSSKELLSDLIS